MATNMRTTLVSLAILCGSTALPGCGSDFDPASEVKTLRVLGVEKSDPYPAAGGEVELSLLWHDGSERAPRDVQRVWLGGCVNPPGDLFYECEPSLTAELEKTLAALGAEEFSLPDPGSLPEDSLLGVGDTFRMTIPEDVIRPGVPGTPDYGIVYVWYALCAGTLGRARVPGPFPLACFDANGRELDVPDFVVGYTTLYAFDGITNANPRLAGLSFAGQDVTPDCIGEDCVGLAVPDAASLDCDTVPCVPSCSGKDCPKYSVKPTIDRESVEVDPIASVAGGTRTEQFWVSYYVNEGTVDDEGLLVNDPTQGWQADHGTKIKPPSEPGAFQFWAVVHDNRGGTAWVRQTILVTDGEE